MREIKRDNEGGWRERNYKNDQERSSKIILQRMRYSERSEGRWKILKIRIERSSEIEIIYVR